MAYRPRQVPTITTSPAISQALANSCLLSMFALHRSCNTFSHVAEKSEVRLLYLLNRILRCYRVALYQYSERKRSWNRAVVYPSVCVCIGRSVRSVYCGKTVIGSGCHLGR